MRAVMKSCVIHIPNLRIEKEVTSENFDIEEPIKPILQMIQPEWTVAAFDAPSRRFGSAKMRWIIGSWRQRMLHRTAVEIAAARAQKMWGWFTIV